MESQRVKGLGEELAICVRLHRVLFTPVRGIKTVKKIDNDGKMYSFGVCRDCRGLADCQYDLSLFQVPYTIILQAV